MKSVWVGIDIGSVSVKLAALSGEALDERHLSQLKESDRFTVHPNSSSLSHGGHLILSEYVRHRGEPVGATKELLQRFFECVPASHVASVWATGSGGKACGQWWGCRYVNAFRAAAEGVAALYPDVKTIFELGGEKARYILLDRDGGGSVQIVDYETNGECAAGTGSFFDQQVDRLHYDIHEIGRVLAGAERSAAIAGRCSVFAKSDMIHAQQRGYQPPEVLRGLCEAVVRNFKGNITKGKLIDPMVAFIGGVAFNQGVLEAVREQFAFSDGELIVPEHAAWMGAIGAAVVGMKEAAIAPLVFPSLADKKEEFYPTTTPLSMKNVRLLRDRVEPYRFKKNTVMDAWLGIDIGSVSTNLALVDADGNLIHGIYRMTKGRPVEVVRDSLQEMKKKVGEKVRVTGVGTTGSGRELIGLLVGADVIKDEITAHKTGAVHVSRRFLDSNVDTIFEVGGQDSKFISIQNGVVVDFSLNEACAAGTGSFLEEQAKQLDIQIKEEFARLALGSKHPLKLGERCTVFMEKELVPYLHRGVPRQDIVAGLAFSVVANYLNRVVKKRRIGDVIFFQGGTAYNDAVAAAFSTVLDKEITVPPHNGIMGAIGAALLSKDAPGKAESGFRGWELDHVTWNLREFTCKACSNHCLVQEFEVEGEKSYWGDKCSDRYRQRTKANKEADILDLIRFREEAIGLIDEASPPRSSEKRTVGIPRALSFYERLPFWRAYFEALGFDVVVSRPTRKDVIQSGIEATVAEPCFPVQAAHGHLVDLLDQEVDIVFLPNVVNEEDPTESVSSFSCPWAQTLPLVALHTPALKTIEDRLFYPSIQFRWGEAFVRKQLEKSASALGISARQNKDAVRAAYRAQAAFRGNIEKAGQKVLDVALKNIAICVVLLGRPYNLYDPGLNLNIPAKLRSLYGVNVIPMDFLPLENVDIRDVHDHMFWNYGRRIIQAARFAREYPNFHIIYMSNFKCGPDSYIRHYIQEASGEPFLFLQLDSHANDAGVMTRVEAFLESKNMI